MTLEPEGKSTQKSTAPNRFGPVKNNLDAIKINDEPCIDLVVRGNHLLFTAD